MGTSEVSYAKYDNIARDKQSIDLLEIKLCAQLLINKENKKKMIRWKGGKIAKVC